MDESICTDKSNKSESINSRAAEIREGVSYRCHLSETLM